MSKFVSARRETRRRPLAGPLLAFSLLLSSLVVPASAAAAPAATAVPDEAPTAAAAQDAARKGNKSVRVVNETDESTEVRANPDGTFTWTQHVRPVRVKQSGKWADADPTLVRRADGTIGPRATVVDLTLSGGGKGSKARGPLVKIAAKDVEAGLSWADDLPVPVLDGPTATYPEVFPGVDIKITADVLGYSEVLVVKTPEAARNPKLKKITFGSHTKGGKAKADKGNGSGKRSDVPADQQSTGDGVKVEDESGRPALKGDASAMWDSSAESTPELRGAGLGANTAAMGLEVTDTTLTIEPDQAFLSAPTTKYPVYLDPDYNCNSCGKAHHLVVQSLWPTAKNFDRTGGTNGVFNDLKAGYVCEGGDCFKSRTYLRMSTWSLAGKKINSAYLHVDTIHSYYCSGATPTWLYLAGWVDANSDWSNQPGASGAALSSGNAMKNVNHCPGNPGGMDLAATSAIQSAADGGWGETTFLLQGEREDNDSSWRRFNLNPYLVVKYNSYPYKPVDLGIEGWGMNVGDALGCGSFVATRTPRLRARLSDPDGGNMNALFHVSPGGSQTGVAFIPSGSFGEVTIPAGKIAADGAYTWHVTVGDDQLLGPPSDYCSMTIDTTKPDKPDVTSPIYPAGKDAGGLGLGGTFTFSAPPPGSPNHSGNNDIAYYLYSLPGQGDDPQNKVTPTALNGSVTVTWAPMVTGPQKVLVRSVDRAGNRSDIVTHQIDVSDYKAAVSGKVSRWSFEDSLVDSSEAMSLVYVGPPPPGGYGDEGKEGLGRSIVMDGVIDEYYQAKRAMLSTDSSFTVSAWAKLHRDDADATVLSQDGARVSGFKLYYDDTVDRWAFGVPNTDTDNPSTVYKALSTSPPRVDDLIQETSDPAPTDTEWTHLTGVYDSPANKLLLYVDGVLNGSVTLPATPWNAAGPFVIGSAKVNGIRGQGMTGAVDSVRVHKRALSAAEVTALHTGSATGDPSTEYLFTADPTPGDPVFETLRNSTAKVDLQLAGRPANYQTGYTGKGYQTDRLNATWPQTVGPIISTTDSFTVGGWVKLVDKNWNHAIASQAANNTSAFILRYAQEADRWTFGVPKVDAKHDQYQWAVGTSSPKLEEWNHVVGTFDSGLKKVTIYVNGIKEAEAPVTTNIAATGPFMIGSATHLGYNYMNLTGMVDEIVAYNGLVTDGDVKDYIANTPVERARFRLDETSGTVAANSVVGGNAGTVHGDGVTWAQTNGFPSANFDGVFVGNSGRVAGSPPLGAWAFNGTTAEYSGTGRDLAHVDNAGATPPTYVNARAGQGVKLNGVSQRLERAQVLTTTSSYSVSAWVNPDRADTGFTVVGQDGARTSPFLLEHAGGRWAFTMVGADTDAPSTIRASSVLAPKVGMWTHLLGVYDAQAGKARLYVNGYLEDERWVSSTWSSTGLFTVGRGKWAGNPAGFFPGAIDETRVYDRALTATDAHGLWNLTSDISMKRPDSLRIDKSFTTSAWVRPAAYDAAPRQAISMGATGRFSSVLVGYRPEWKRWALMTETGGGLTPGTTKWILSDNEAQTYGEGKDGWVHLTVTYDATRKKASLYVNGIEQTTVPVDATTFKKVSATPEANYAGANLTLTEPARDLLIGRTTWEGLVSDPWKGAIRDVRVFTGVVPSACDDSPYCVSQLQV
ncbi:LamG-like jellyroll fold domain-containing protein [Actinokineospora sp. HUAS TT18]|uniref:LamG-like jellyroll fold domain-containing protein n=1 Tax=Actinokineospora sp. HUAS TT18 TaxID=3447451 RepID=UPI003F526C0F